MGLQTHRSRTRHSKKNSSSPPEVTLEPPHTTCPICNHTLKAYKTRKKTIHFPVTSLRIKESQRTCTRCQHVYTSPLYKELTPPRSTTSWGLIAYIGQQRFHHNRQIQEISKDLDQRGVRVSESTIVRASDTYLERYVALHDDQSLWKKLLPEHIYWEMDATTDGGDGNVFVIRCNGYTVLAHGIPSEAKDHIKPLVAETIKRTGEPVSVGRDFAEGPRKALEETVPDTVHVGCHFHFLRDAGKDLMGTAHAELGRLLGKDHTRARLQALARDGEGEWHRRVASCIGWALTDNGGPAFPFRRPALELVQRLDLLWDWACDVLKVGARENRSVPEVVELKEVLRRYRLDQPEPVEVAREVRRQVGFLQRVLPWFESVRKALREFRESGQSESDAEAVKQVLERVEKEARSVGREEGEAGLDLVAAVYKRWDELFAPVVCSGGVLAVERTIVETEQSHGEWKRGVRRRTGKSRVAVALRYHGVALSMVENWERPEFREVLGGGQGLVRALAGVGDERVGRARDFLRSLRREPGWRRRRRGMGAAAVLVVPETVVVEGG